MVILENIDIDIDIDKAILQNIDIDKISNRFKFGISNRASTGYAFLHEEGASCDLCHRLQQPVFSSRADKDTEEEVFKPIA